MRISDWSSDVCSSDLQQCVANEGAWRPDFVEAIQLLCPFARVSRQFPCGINDVAGALWQRIAQRQEGEIHFIPVEMKKIDCAGTGAQMRAELDLGTCIGPLMHVKVKNARPKRHRPTREKRATPVPPAPERGERTAAETKT